MRNTKSLVVILAAVTAWAAQAASSFGQENRKGRLDEASNKLEQAKRELEVLTKELDYKKGDDVVVLKDAPMKVQTKTVGTMRRGQMITVQAVQDKWLWVQSGKTKGWIDNASVLDVALYAWYQRLPDNESLEHSGRARAKFDGLMFEIVNPGSKLLWNYFRAGGTVNGMRFPDGRYVNSKNVNFFPARAGGNRYRLLVKFPGGDTFPNMRALKSYGVVERGDYVVIFPDERRVVVNGERREPQMR